MKNPTLKNLNRRINLLGFLFFVSAFQNPSYLSHQTNLKIKDMFMSEYISNDNKQRIEAIQYTNLESAMEIKSMLDRFPCQVEVGPGKLLINSKPVKPGRFVCTTWTAIVVQDSEVILERFKPVQVQDELF